MAKVVRHLTIHGRVQDVWFRDWTVKTAGELGLAGWVRNRRKGTVEAVVQGEKSAVERFLELVQEGPPAANVINIDVTERTAFEGSGFTKKPTV